MQSFDCGLRQTLNRSEMTELLPKIVFLTRNNKEHTKHTNCPDNVVEVGHAHVVKAHVD